MKNFLLIVLSFVSSTLAMSQNTDWVKSFGGTESDKGISIGVDSLGYIYISGYYNTSADFDQINLTNNSAGGKIKKTLLLN